MVLKYDFDGRSSRVEPATWIGLFIGLWLVLMLFSMLTSLAYCCCSFRWQKTVSSSSVAIELKRFSFNGVEESSSSIIEQLLNSFLKTHSYPEPEKKKKKRKSKRKFKMKNGWRLTLQKRKGTRKGERKRKPAEQKNLDQQLRLHGYLINGKDTQSQKPSQSSNKPNLRPKKSCLIKKAVPLITRNSIKRHQMRPSVMHGPNTPGCPPKLKGKRKTLMLLNRAKRRIKQRIIARSQVPLYVKCDTQPPVPYHCLQYPCTITSNYLEGFMLETPEQDTDSQSDEFYGYIHCTTGLNCNLMNPPLLKP